MHFHSKGAPLFSSSWPELIALMRNEAVAMEKDVFYRILRFLWDYLMPLSEHEL